MILNLHGSMGDNLMMTGIPEAFYMRFREKTHVPHKRNPIFWRNNPYITDEPTGESFSLKPNVGRDYMIYYPVRVFHDITGHVVQAREVRPNIYMHRKPEKLIVINDQAGWPSRRGYRFLDELVVKLKNISDVLYMRNHGFRDCHGVISQQEITWHDETVFSPDDKLMIDTMARAAVYIGYDSGYSVLAGALNVPHVLLSGSVPPINTAHPSCIYALEIPGCKRCASPECDNGCLPGSENKNKEIVGACKLLL